MRLGEVERKTNSGGHVEKENVIESNQVQINITSRVITSVQLGVNG